MDIKDIAAMANMSIATVSRFFSHPERLSEKTKIKIKKITDEVGYVPNQMGASLRTRRSNNIVAIMPETSKPVNAAIIRALEQEAQKHGYGVLLGDTQNLRERELHYGKVVKRGQADGILLFSPNLPFDTNQKSFAENKLPPIVNANEMVPDVAISKVCIDNEAAAIELMTHLFSLGHSKIAAITGPNSAPSSNERLSGYRLALQNSGIEVDENLIFIGNYTLQSGEKMALKIIESEQKPTAIFAFNDDMAIGCLKTLKTHQYRIPEDISVAGFDDTTYSNYVSPTLTTVQQPLEEIGKIATSLLIKTIKDPTRPPEKIKLDVKLIIRESTGPCAKF